jgi:dihydroneopterin aldolase
MADRRPKGAKPKPKRKSGARLAQARAARGLDRVFMHDLVLDVEIGVYTHEKGVTQRVRFSVDVDILPASVALNDDIGKAFDYDTIIHGIKDIIAEGHINLVETLAERIADHCLAHPRASSVRVTIEKLDKEPGAVGVEIVRTRVGG